MTAQTFIFVHDQQIVLDYIAADKFHDLPDVKYCFLGQRDVDQIEHLDNVIIARNLPNNIEHLPNLVAWTGWYAVLRNGLITADYVNLFEYDVNISDTWTQCHRNSGYFWHPTADLVWWNYNNIQYELHKAVRFPAQGPLPMTSNYTLSEFYLKELVNQMMGKISNNNLNPKHPQAGHIIERFCSFLLQTVVGFGDGVAHLYADSHGTQGRGDRYQQIKSQLL
jgi:hypothetical protein